MCFLHLALFWYKPYSRKSNKNVSGYYILEYWRPQSLQNYPVSEKLIQNIHCCPNRITRSAILLNPTVSFVKFKEGAELHNYGLICLLFRQFVTSITLYLPKITYVQLLFKRKHPITKICTIDLWINVRMLIIFCTTRIGP